MQLNLGAAERGKLDEQHQHTTPLHYKEGNAQEDEVSQQAWSMQQTVCALDVKRTAGEHRPAPGRAHIIQSM